MSLQPDPGQWLTDNWSDIRPWGKPNKVEQFGKHYQAVWYSDNEDPDNSVSATMVEISPTETIITEYTHSSEWDYELPDEDKEPPHWKTQSVEFDTGWLYKTILEQIRRGAETSGTPASRVRPPRGPEAVAEWAATVGIAYISYYGGDEDVADSLP